MIPNVIKTENISVSPSMDKAIFKAFDILRAEAIKNARKLKNRMFYNLKK